MLPGRSMQRSAVPSSFRRHLSRALCALALLVSGCGGGGDYYYVGDILGEGDTVRLLFLFTCGTVDVTWNGAFVGQSPSRAELAVNHDDLGRDCDEDPREVSFDVGPMKRAFRAERAFPAPLALRVPPFEEEHGAICVPNLFQDQSFDGKRCK
jgi:hypothetical protein